MGDPLRLGLIGFGNVGSGVVKALEENRELLAARCPRPLELRRIADIDLERRRPVTVDPKLLTTDAESVVRDPEIDVIIELIGGIEPARTLVETALAEGKSVVTANKAMLASHGPELLALAAEKGVRLLFEAAVGGGIPVVRALCESLAANKIERIQGILNGTSNYILSQMIYEEMSYEEALAEAQTLGYAEPDPTADVEGIDAANKIAILASLAFGFDIRYSDVYRVGISKLTRQDHKIAATEQYVIKPLATAEITEPGAVGISVQPAVVSISSPLATVGDVMNGIIIEGFPVGVVFLVGPGAGPEPTASAVLGDLMALSLLESDRAAPRPFLEIPVGKRPRITAECDCDGYWIRVFHRGGPDALAEIVCVLTEEHVPILKCIEEEREGDESGVSRVVVVLTDTALWEDIRCVVRRLGEAEWLEPDTSVLVMPRFD